MKENITINIFKRIMYENSFYGLMATGYLAWSSVFYGLKNGFDGLNAFGAFLIISAWLGYVVLFCIVDSSPAKVSEQKNKEITILKGFGEFRDVFHQVSKAKSTQKPASQRVYVLMMAERVLISAIIVLASSILPMPNLFIVAVNLIMIIGLLIMHKKTQEGLADDEKR